MNAKTALISINAAWNILNFRKGLIERLLADGWKVVALAPPDAAAARLTALGVEMVPIEMDNQGTSPWRDAKLFLAYLRALRRIRPAVFLGYTAKPNIYGSLAAQLLGIPVINNVSGLGTAFISDGPLTKLLSGLYRLAFRRSRTVFFQNPEDRDLFVAKAIVTPGQAKLLPGSGIDLAHFAPDAGEPKPAQGFAFLLVGRLLWDKGVREYVEAARIVRAARPGVQFRLLGFLDVANRSAVPRSNVERWVAEGLIDYLGETDDVRPAIAASDCVVLPSYREGLPRTLLEASAMAKPLIATDVPGCRHIVEDGRNGFLCAVRDSKSLADAMMRMVDLDEAARRGLGRQARARVEAEFDQRLVVDAYLEAIDEALARA